MNKKSLVLVVNVNITKCSSYIENVKNSRKKLHNKLNEIKIKLFLKLCFCNKCPSEKKLL